MKHDHHTSEHKDSCIRAARRLVQAANKVLEAGQYQWTAVARLTLEEAETDLTEARGHMAEAKRLTEKVDLATELPPVSVPGKWPIASG